MSDFVERLRLSAKNSEERGWLTQAVLDREAANEIERLRDEIESWVAMGQRTAREAEQSCTLANKLADDNARLRKTNITMLNVLKACRLLLVQRDQRPDEARVLNAILIVIAEAEGQSK